MLTNTTASFTSLLILFSQSIASLLPLNLTLELLLHQHTPQTYIPPHFIYSRLHLKPLNYNQKSKPPLQLLAKTPPHIYILSTHTP